MAHPQQLCFMDVVSKHLAPGGYDGKRILEIGSYDVNGSIRSLFQNSSYSGVDLMSGPGVDIVCPGDKVSSPDGSYDVTISCECFEHNPQWLETFLNMYRMTRAGGILVFTCASTGRLEHGTARTDPLESPGTQNAGWNYYRNLTEADFRSRVSFESLFDTHLFMKNRRSKDLYFIGRKRGDGGDLRFDARDVAVSYDRASRELEKFLSDNNPYPRPLRVLARITLLPVDVAALLPEKQFQDFAVGYCKIDTAVKEWALKLLFGKKLTAK